MGVYLFFSGNEVGKDVLHLGLIYLKATYCLYKSKRRRFIVSVMFYSKIMLNNSAVHL